MDLLLILIVILIIVLVWRGPQMLPQIGAALGKAVKGVRDAINEDGRGPGDSGAAGDGADAADASDTDPVDDARPGS